MRISDWSSDVCSSDLREIMRELGYGPDNRLNIQVSARNVASFRDPAVILIDHLKEIYIDATLETIEVALWYVRLAKRDYAIALNLTGNVRSEEHTSELQSLMRISYAVFCLKKKNYITRHSYAYKS